MENSRCMQYKMSLNRKKISEGLIWRSQKLNLYNSPHFKKKLNLMFRDLSQFHPKDDKILEGADNDQNNNQLFSSLLSLSYFENL